MRRVGGLALSILALAPAAVSADSFTPVRLQVVVTPVARAGHALALTVKVSADPGVLDDRTAPLRARAKLSTQCGGVFDQTPGVVLVDARLQPQPDPGRAYQGSATGSGKPSSYGVQTVCVYLEEEGDNRQFANDTDTQVTVSQPCTAAAAKYDSAAASLARARTALRHAHTASARTRLRRLVAKRKATAASLQRKARSACGPGVPL